MIFLKAHGTQNDFVVLPDPECAVRLSAPYVAQLCDRRAGIGADGVIRLSRAKAVSYTHLTLTKISDECRTLWEPYK